jgi:hypothetical protein
MPAPRGVNPAQWAKLGLKAQYQLWALGKAIATPNLNPGLSASIGCAAADIGTLLANEEIGNEVARLTNKLIGDLEAGEQVGSAFLVLNSGSVQSYAASLAYAGCQFYNELRYNLPFLSQNAFDAAKKMVQVLAEGSTDFPTTLQQFNLTEWGLFGVRAAYAQSYGETCQSKVFGNRTASDFDMREEDLFGPAARSGGGPSGRVPYVPPPPWLFTDAFGDCIGAEPERSRPEL